VTDTDAHNVVDMASERDECLQAAGGYLAAAAVQYAAVVAAKEDPAALYRALNAQQRAFVAATQAQMRAAQLATHIASEAEDASRDPGTS
jgi:hypothetical protein